MLFEYVLFAHLLATAIMLGITWFVQLIHYPLYTRVDNTGFVEYELEHIRRTKYLIMPAMLTELVSACMLVFLIDSSGIYYWLNLFLLTAIWASTFFVQVPLHSRLTILKNDDNIRRLVNSNWIRTVLWSFRMLLLIGILVFQL